jgi:hypothetical protein
LNYYTALIFAFMLILALSWCAHAEEYMVASYGVATHHRAPPRTTAHHRHHQSRGRSVLAHVKEAATRLAVIPLPRPNPLDAPRPGMYEVDAALLLDMMFGIHIVRRGADW